MVSGFERPVLRRLDRFEHGHVDPLQDAHQHVPRRQVILVQVGADGEHASLGFFHSLDDTQPRIPRQLKHHKGKLYDKGRGNSLARGALPETTEDAVPERKVVKVKRFPLKPMILEEAIEQMELLEHSFFLYFDAEAEEPKLIYQRKDGNYGLIEAELG